MKGVIIKMNHEKKRSIKTKNKDFLARATAVALAVNMAAIPGNFSYVKNLEKGMFLPEITAEAVDTLTTEDGLQYYISDGSESLNLFIKPVMMCASSAPNSFKSSIYCSIRPCSSPCSNL